jgi:hypothetical protein
MSDLKKNHADAAIKGAALGVLTYAGTQFNLSPELIALLVPVVATALSVVSTKIGDKNTALLLKVATQAIDFAPVKKTAAPAKKAPAKKTTAAKKK